MNILFINHRDLKHPSAGGAEEYLHQIARRLVSRGHEVSLLVERPKGLPDLDAVDGVRIIRRGGFISLYVWSALHLFRHGDRYDVIVDNIAHVFPFCSSKIARRLVVAVVHHINGPALRKVLPRGLWPAGAIAERYILPRCYQYFIAVSKSTREELIRLGVDPDRVYVIYNGVDHDIYKPGPKSEKPTVLWLNRFVRYKNPDHAVIVFSLVKKAVPDATFIMAGDGPERLRVQRLAQSLGIDVTFTGRVSLEEKVRLLQRAWVCLYTSDVEGWGVVALEAAASGTPCVGYAVGGLRESIVDGKTGFLVPLGDVAAMAERVVSLLSDEVLRNSLSRNAIEFSRQFSWDRSAEKFERVLINILGQL